MVKSNQPLQIRLTEPVIFLRGPSTGLDFRGRPQGIDPNAAPAMLRGLLTLRLSKPTRIRSITIKLDGKARTEWPEGIGQRRLDTFEEHVIMHETTTFFDAKRSHSQNNRRANSVPPALFGISAGGDASSATGRSRSTQRRGSDDEDRAYDSALDSGLDMDRGRGRGRALPRSASALPGFEDGAHGWRRGEASRRPSYDADSSRPPSHSDNVPTLSRLNLNDARGPSPAYTPTAETPTVPYNSVNGGHAVGSSRAFRESVLSPIQSAVPSRATSERDGSTETQNRRLASDSRSPPPPRLDNVDERPGGTSDVMTTAVGSAEASPPSEEEQQETPNTESELDIGSDHTTPSREVNRTELDEEHGHAIRSILSGSASASRRGSGGGTPRSRPSQGGEVRFAPPEPGQDQASGSGSGARLGDYHPAGSAIHAISAVSTAHNSPAPSRPQSIMAAQSTDDLTESVDTHADGEGFTSAPAVSSPLTAAPTGPTAEEADAHETRLGRVSSESARSTHSRRSNLSTRSNRSNLSLRSAAAHGAAVQNQSSSNGNAISTSPVSNRSSLLRDAQHASGATGSSSGANSGAGTPTNANPSAASSTSSLQEIRQGRKNRHGSHSTIVINNDPSVAPAPPIEAISSNPASPRQSSSAGQERSSLGPTGPGSSTAPRPGVSPYGQPQGFGESGHSSSGGEDRGRRGTGSGSGRFSLAATLRGLSKDVKERVRASSRSKSRAGFGSGQGSTADLSSYPGSGTNSGSGSSLRGRGVTPGGGRDNSTSRSRSTSIRHASGSGAGVGDGLLPPPMPGSRIERSPSHLGAGAAQPERVRAMRSGSFTRQDPDFVPPFGRGGAGRVNSASRERERERSRSRTGESPGPRPGSASRTASAMGRIKEEDGQGRKDKGKRSESRGRGRHMGMKILTDALGLGAHDAHDNEHGHGHANGADGKEEGEGYRDEHGELHNWKEFKKGTYNYPISFPIPLTAPPTIHAEFGSVSYRLKATVVRVGALTSNLAEEMEVTMIATPQEDDLEETENVIVERQWEEQMRYQIVLSGKAFPIGGTIPISIRLMPLTKCKVHRLSMCLEEKTDYYAQGKKVVRHETPRRYMMLFVKQPDKKERIEPLLPIISDDVDAARSSPLAELAKAAALSNPATYSDFAGRMDDDALYATLMDPSGPWHLEANLQIPDCANRVRFSSKHEKTNISISHWLKVTIRVERGDDEALDAKGRRKLFDIIIETPIKILDCRVNPQWNSLPTYTSFNPSSTAVLTGLCSIHGTKHKAATATGPGSTSGAGPSGTAGSYISRPGSAANLSGANGHVSGTGLADLAGLVLPPSIGGASTGISSVPGSSSGLHALGQASGSGHGTPRRREEGDDTLLERNIVYDRLMSGQQTEEGDVPPSYEAAAQATAAEGMAGGRSRQGSAIGLDGTSGRRADSPGATPRGRPLLLRGESEEDGAVMMGSTSSSRSRERRGRASQVGDSEARGRSKSRLRSEVI